MFFLYGVYCNFSLRFAILKIKKIYINPPRKKSLDTRLGRLQLGTCVLCSENIANVFYLFLLSILPRSVKKKNPPETRIKRKKY